MKQTVSVKELKSGGYTRFPRLFIDLLLQDYYPKNKTRLKIGVFIYIFGKLANKPYNYRYAGGKRERYRETLVQLCHEIEPIYSSLKNNN